MHALCLCNTLHVLYIARTVHGWAVECVALLSRLQKATNSNPSWSLFPSTLQIVYYAVDFLEISCYSNIFLVVFLWGSYMYITWISVTFALPPPAQTMGGTFTGREQDATKGIYALAGASACTCTYIFKGHTEV